MALTKITSNAFAASAVDSDAVGANTITTAKIADNNVTTTKIADNNVTHAKLHTDMDLSSKTVKLSNLDINADYNIVERYKSDGSTRLGYFLFRDDGPNYLEFNDTGANQDFRFASNNSTIVTIKADGKVGIGTTSPGQKLTVAGGIESTNSQGSVAFYATTAGSYNQQNGAGGTAWAYGSTGGTSSPATAASTTFGFHHWNGSAWSNPLNILTSGNVGIGELDPDEKLHITNSTGSYIKHEGPSSGDYATGYQVFEGSTLSAAFYTNPSHDLTILSKDGMTFRLDNANRIKFTSTGNVGIGTTNPTHPLHISATNPSGNVVAKFENTANPWVQWAGPSTSWQFGATSNGFEFYNDNNGTTKATLNTYGDLGLGTQTPNVYSSGNWRTITLNGVSGGELDFEVNGSLKGDIFAGAQDFYLRHHDSNATMRFRVGGSSINEERMTIAANGTVGMQSRVTVGTLNAKTGLSRMRVGRSLINFFNYGLNSTGNNYLHIKTSLYMGSASNTQPTMSLVHIKGYTYAGESIDSMFGFHNWSGGFYAPVYTNNGSRTVVSPSYNSYQSTDGYAVLVLNIGTSYPGITIDWHQAYEYTFQDVQVSAYQRSSSSTGVY